MEQNKEDKKRQRNKNR